MEDPLVPVLLHRTLHLAHNYTGEADIVAEVDRVVEAIGNEAEDALFLTSDLTLASEVDRKKAAGVVLVTETSATATVSPTQTCVLEIACGMSVSSSPRATHATLQSATFVQRSTDKAP